MCNIVLIGFMGTGKTTTGRILAEKLGWAFVDIDSEIENTCGMSISDIFKQYGEEFFREKERLTIKKMLDCRNTIIATGGGAILSEENVRHLQRCGRVIALQAHPEIILERIEKDAVARPLLKSPDRFQTISRLLQERAGKYQIAEHCIDTSSLAPWGVASAIIRLIRPLRRYEANSCSSLISPT